MWCGVIPACAHCVMMNPAHRKPSPAITSLELADEQGKAPLLSVFGGKLTTYRKLAQAARHKLAPYFFSTSRED